MTHPRLSVSGISSWNWSLDEELAFCRSEGISTIGLALRKIDLSDVEPVVRAISASGVRVGNVIGMGPFDLERPEQWREHHERLRQALLLADRVGAPQLVMTTGCAGRAPWEIAANSLVNALGPVRETAGHLGVRLALEHTNSLRTDVSFVHTLRDAIDLARMLGEHIGVCMEVNACWAERGLADTIAAGIDRISLVQVSDQRIGTTSTPDRLVPGDGDIPLERLVRLLLDAGYAGPFDLELVGPRIEREGYASAIRRSVVFLEDVLTTLGA
jgi:sugar phosphate isomerase/epimerase